MPRRAPTPTAPVAARPAARRPPETPLQRRARLKSEAVASARNTKPSGARALLKASLNTQSLTAAAMVLDGGLDGLEAPLPNAVTRTWQWTATSFLDTVPELSAARMYVGNALARVRLKVGKRNPDGTVVDAFDGAEPVEGLDQAIADEAADIIATIRTEIGGQSELMRSYAQKMFVNGELYLVPRDSPAGMTFEVLSTMELLRSGNDFTIFRGPGFPTEPLDPNVTPIRIWRPDDRYNFLATSSVRSCLGILSELDVLTRLVMASSLSRMSLSGMIVLPDSADSPIDDGTGEDGQTSEQMNPLLADIIVQGCKAVDDPSSPAAFMPYIAQVPDEAVNLIHHVPFQSSGVEHMDQRAEAIGRLAMGLDLPPEIVLGHKDSTFTNAIQISEDTFKVYLLPMVQLLVDAVTIAVLWPAMAKNRGLDPDRVKAAGYPEEILTVAVHYDASDLISHPDKSKELADLYVKDLTFSAVRTSEVRMAYGLDPTETVDDDEKSARLDTYQRAHIRETITPLPGGQVDLSLGAQGTSIVTGTTGATGPAEEPQGVTAALASQIAGAADLLMERVAERLGSKVRSAVRNKPDVAEFSVIGGVSNENITRVLGRASVERLVTDLPAMLRTELDGFARAVTKMAARAGHPSPKRLAEHLSLKLADMLDAHLYGQGKEASPDVFAPLVDASLA